jgi:hypothetical protein
LRDAQVNTVWEGTSNIMGLEVLKILGREAKQTQGKQFALLEEVGQTLESVTMPELREYVHVVAEQIPLVLKQIRLVLTADPLTQNAYARKLTERLTDLFTVAHLLEEAQYAKRERGTSRLIKVAEYAVNRAYRPEWYEIGGGRVPALTLYDSVVRFTEK